MELIERLRKAAIECAEEGVNGYGNLMSEAADEIAKLEDDIQEMHMDEAGASR